MPGSPKKNTSKPAYDRPGDVDDPEIVAKQEIDAAEGHDQREALMDLIKKAAKTKENEETGDVSPEVGSDKSL